mmetsp:Transcript_30991/g.101015  ORF Transcript_30991/g.101015 Transcript_30991/m.101015 type:complete len:258 (-) Transcript_30991:674-1447(-)
MPPVPSVRHAHALLLRARRGPSHNTRIRILVAVEDEAAFRFEVEPDRPRIAVVERNGEPERGPLLHGGVVREDERLAVRELREVEPGVVVGEDGALRDAPRAAVVLAVGAPHVHARPARRAAEHVHVPGGGPLPQRRLNHAPRDILRHSLRRLLPRPPLVRGAVSEGAPRLAPARERRLQRRGREPRPVAQQNRLVLHRAAPADVARHELLRLAPAQPLVVALRHERLPPVDAPTNLEIEQDATRALAVPGPVATVH